MTATYGSITQGRPLRTRRAGAVVLHDVLYPAGVFMPVHRHATANITLLIGGDLQETTESGLARSGSLSVVFKPSRVEHQTEVGGRGLRTFVVELDAAAERELRRDGVPDRCRWTDNPDLVASIVGLWARVETSEKDVPHIVGGWLRSLAGMRWDAHTLRETAHSPARLPDPLVRAVARLESGYASPLGPADLAEGLEMHPVSVTRLFRRHLGCGVKACLRSIRVRHAADRLAQTDTPIARIAGQIGFCDQAHLSREFRRSTGLTPGQYRRLAADPQGLRRAV